VFSNREMWGEGPTFVLAAFALMPLTELIGHLTDQIALHTNDSLGCLLNATFGNIAGLLICLAALQKAQQARVAGDLKQAESYLSLVQTSLLGSMLANLLLVQGSAFLVGGLRQSVQIFNYQSSITSTGLLILSVLGLSVPTMMTKTGTEADALLFEPSEKLLSLSRIISGCYLIIYFSFIFFQLKTHIFLFKMDRINNLENHNFDLSTKESSISNIERSENRSDSELGFLPALFWLALFSVCVAFLSTLVVGAAEKAVDKFGLSPLFVGGIVLPIVGNASQHASALIFAWRDKMDVAIGVAVGSAIQISLFIWPTCIFVGWAMGVPFASSLSKVQCSSFNLTQTTNINIQLMMAIIIVASVALAFTLHAGSSHWLHGLVFLNSSILAKN